MYKQIVRLSFRTAAVVAAGLLAGPTIGFASIKVCGVDGSCGIAQAINDEEMAAVAGKYTIAGEVVGMNLSMTSSWMTANGGVLDATANISVALPNSGQARSYASTHATFNAGQGGQGRSHGSDRSVVAGNGLQSVAGVAQVIQVAGENNDASNKAFIEVSAKDVFRSGGYNQSNLSYAGANGAEAMATITNNGVSIRLAMPGAGVVQQQVNMASMGNIHQHIHIAADGQHVANRMHLQLQLQPHTNHAVLSQGVGHSLNMLRGR